MKFRNRNLFQAGLPAALFSACILTAGTVRAASLQDITAASEKALSELAGGSFQLSGELSAGFSAGEEQSPDGAGAGMAIRAACTLDPLMLELSGTGKAGIPGARFDTDLHLYLSENEDGSGGVYLCFGLTDPSAEASGTDSPEAGTEGESSAEAEKNWTYVQIPAEQMDVLRAAAGQIQAGEGTLLSALSKLPEGAATLSEEMAAADGKSCYEISVIPGADQLEEIVGTVQEKLFPYQALNNFQKKLVQDICSVLKLSCVIDIDSGSYLPVRMSLDTAGTDFGILAGYLEKLLPGGQPGPDTGTEEGSGSGLISLIAKGIPALKLEVLFDYGKDVSIVVPEEALEARAAYLADAPQPGTPLMTAGFGTG